MEFQIYGIQISILFATHDIFRHTVSQEKQFGTNDDWAWSDGFEHGDANFNHVNFVIQNH